MEGSAVYEFVANFDKLITNNQTDEALSAIFEPENEEIVQLACLDLLTSIGQRLVSGKLFQRDVETWCTLQSVLDYVVKISKPKEILIGLLDLLEQVESDEFFDLLIKPLKVTFLRLPSKQNDTLLWALNGLYDYLRKIPLMDYDRYFENSKEKKLLENCPNLMRVDSCVNSLLNFVEPFVSEAKQCKILIDNIEQRNRQVLALASILLKLLEYPLSHYNIDKSIKKSNLERFQTVQRVLSMLFDLTPNVYWKIIDWHWNGKLTIAYKFLDPKSAGQAEVKPQAIGVLSTFVFCYGLSADQLPLVYSFEYISHSVVPFAVALLDGRSTDSTESYIRLGLRLCKFLTQLTQEKSWPTSYLVENWHVRRIYFALIKCVGFSQSQKQRQRSFKLFRKFLSLLDDQAMLSSIRMIFHFLADNGDIPDDDISTFRCEKHKAEHNAKLANQNAANEQKEAELTTMRDDHQFCHVPLSCCNGIKGYMIDYYRNRLWDELKLTDGKFSQNTSTSSSIPIGPFEEALPSMIGLFTTLKDKEETNLLDHYEHIMAVLTLLRLICIYRKKLKQKFLVKNMNLQNKILQPQINKQAPSTPAPAYIISRDTLKSVNDRFLSVLIKALELSKAHYELDVKNLHKEQQQQHQNCSSACENSTSEHTSFSSLRRNATSASCDDEQLKVLRQALLSLDLMHSLVGRVNELVRICLDRCD